MLLPKGVAPYFLEGVNAPNGNRPPRGLGWVVFCDEMLLFQILANDSEIDSFTLFKI